MSLSSPEVYERGCTTRFVTTSASSKQCPAAPGRSRIGFCAFWDCISSSSSSDPPCWTRQTFQQHEDQGQEHRKLKKAGTTLLLTSPRSIILKPNIAMCHYARYENAGHPQIGCSAKSAEADHGETRIASIGPHVSIHGAPEALQHVQARAPHHAPACSLVYSIRPACSLVCSIRRSTQSTCRNPPSLLTGFRNARTPTSPRSIGFCVTVTWIILVRVLCANAKCFI